MEKQIPFAGILSNKAGENPGGISGCILIYLYIKLYLPFIFLSGEISNLIF